MTGLFVLGYFTATLLTVGAARIVGHNWQRPGGEHIARYAAVVAALAAVAAALAADELHPGNLILALAPLVMATASGLDQHHRAKKGTTWPN